MRRTFRDSGIAVLAVAVATAVRAWLDPLLGDHLSALIFLVPVAAAVWLGGWRPAVVATLLGYLSVNVLFGEPRGTPALHRGEDLVELMLYLTCSIALVVFGERMRSAARRAEVSEQQALAKQRELQHEVSRRIEAERARLRLAAIVESSDDAIISTDLHGVITSWNQGAEHLYGRTAAEATGQSMAVLVPPDRGDELSTILELKQIERGAWTTHRETVRLGRDGHPIEVSETMSPVRDEAGTLVGASAIARDISERKRAEAMLQALKDRLATDLADMERLHEISTRFAQHDEMQHLLEAILDAAINVTQSDMGNIQIWNSESGALAIAAQRGFDQPFVTFFDSVHAGQAACGTALQRAERVIVDDVTDSPIFVGTPALDVLLAAGVRAVQSTPLVARSGRLVGMFSTHYRAPRRPEPRDLRLLDLLARQAADFIERMEVERALRASEARFHAFMEHSPATAYIKDADGRYVFVNRALERMFNRPRAEWIGKTDFDCFPAEVAQPWRDHDLAVLTSGAPLQVTETADQDDGLHHFLSFKFPLEGAGARSLLAGMSVDITALKRTEAALETANRNKDRFLAALAHELGNPLAAIQTAAHVLAAENPTGGRWQAAAEIVQRQTRQLAQLVADLLDVSRVTHDKLHLRRERVELRGVLEGAVETIRPLLDGAGHELSIELPAQAVHVDGDPVRLMQVFSNLLSNAARYTDPGGRIRLSAEHEGSAIRVTIADSGGGIPREMLSDIFGLFTQVPRSSLAPQAGLGIGLTLVKRLVDMHGGSVEAHSDGPGRGSEFVVRLPAVLDAFDGAPATAGRWRQAPAPARVLVVDDNEDAATSLGMLLEILGYEIRTVPGAREAMAAAREFRPKVAVLDIGMPEIDGYELARRFRQQPWGSQIVLIALSGWARPEDRRLSAAAGFSHHIVKPVDSAVLAELLAHVTTDGQPASDAS